MKHIVLFVLFFGITALAACGGRGSAVIPGSPSAHNPFPLARSQDYRSAILADNPTQFFELADTSGTTATDDVTGAPTGTYFGPFTLNVTPGPIAGTSLGTLQLPASGAPQGVSMPSANWTAGSSFTLETFVKPIATGTYETIWGAGDYSHRLLLASNGQLLSQFSGNYYSTGRLKFGAWSQVDFVYNAATQTASYYVNGQLDSTSLTIPTASAHLGTYYLGQYDNSDNYKYEGQIADHSIYPVALTAAQILTHYTAATTIVTPTPTPSPVPTVTGVIIIINAKEHTAPHHR